MVRMLVPTNFSDPSQAVMRYLLPWMNAVGGELFLPHVIPGILSRWSDVMEMIFLEASLQDDVDRDLCEHAHWQLSSLLPPAWRGRTHTIVVVENPRRRLFESPRRALA